MIRFLWLFGTESVFAMQYELYCRPLQRIWCGYSCPINHSDWSGLIHIANVCHSSSFALQLHFNPCHSTMWKFSSLGIVQTLKLIASALPTVHSWIAFITIIRVWVIKGIHRWCSRMLCALEISSEKEWENYCDKSRSISRFHDLMLESEAIVCASTCNWFKRQGWFWWKIVLQIKRLTDFFFARTASKRECDPVSLRCADDEREPSVSFYVSRAVGTQNIDMHNLHAFA